MSAPAAIPAAVPAGGERAVSPREVEPPWARHASLLPESHLGLTGVLVTGLGIGALVPALFIAVLVWRVRRQRRRAREAERSYRHEGALEPGPAVLHGVVELARDSERAMRVAITQRGSERKHKGKWSHTWKEESRETEALPFYLRDDRGERIRVQPDERALLVDRMDQTLPRERTLRVRVAELTPGERIYACGVLVRAHDPEAPQGYRGGASLVLRPDASAREEAMLLSSEPLGARFHARADLHRGWAIGVAVMAVAFQLLMLPSWTRWLAGHSVAGQVVARHIRTSKDSKGRVSYHHEITVRPAGGRPFVEELDDDDYVHVKQADVVPVRRAPPWGDQVGATASVHSALTVAALIVWSLAVLLYISHRYNSRPWYQRKLEESGQGRLPE